MTTIAALQNGDSFIFEEVFHQYHERVYFYVLGKTNSAYVAEEAAQLTFIKLWEYRTSLTESHSLFTQIFRIARTTMIDLLRRQENQLTIVKQLGEQPAVILSDDIPGVTMERELKNRLMHALDLMPPVRRRVFTMSRFEGRSLKEIAESLSLSVKTVEGHITLALKQLRSLLGSFLLLACHIFL